MFDEILQTAERLTNEIRRYSPNYPMVKYDSISGILDEVNKDKIRLSERSKGYITFFLMNLLGIMQPYLHQEEAARAAGMPVETQIPVNVQRMNGDIYYSNIHDALEQLTCYLTVHQSDINLKTEYECYLYAFNLIYLRFIFLYEPHPLNLTSCFINRSPHKCIPFILLLKEQQVNFEDIVKAGVIEIYHASINKYQYSDRLRTLTEQNIISVNKTYGAQFTRHLEQAQKKTTPFVQIRVTISYENIVRLKTLFPYLYQLLLIQCNNLNPEIKSTAINHLSTILNRIGTCQNIPSDDPMFNVIIHDPSYLRFLLPAIHYQTDQLKHAYTALNREGFNVYQSWIRSLDTKKEKQLICFFDNAPEELILLVLKSKDFKERLTLFYFMRVNSIFHQLLHLKYNFFMGNLFELNAPSETHNKKNTLLFIQNKNNLISLLLHFLQFNQPFPITQMMEHESFRNFIDNTPELKSLLSILLPDNTHQLIFKENSRSTNAPLIQSPKTPYRHPIRTLFSNSSNHASESAPLGMTLNTQSPTFV